MPTPALQAAAADPYASIATPIPAASASPTVSDSSDPYASIATPIASTTQRFILPGIGTREFDPTTDEGKQILALHPDARPVDQAAVSAGPTIGPRTPNIPVNIPGVVFAGKVAQHIQDLQNLTQDEKIQHPIKAQIGDLINRLQDLVVGNPEHGGMQTGFATNPVTAMLIPGAPESTLAEKAAATAAKVPEAAVATPAGEGFFTRLTNPFRAKLKAQMASPEAVGEAVSQPIAQAGVKATAPPVGASLRSGIDVETPLAAAKKLYQTVDAAAKTDFKVLYDKLDAAQDAARIAAPGSPEEAIAQRNIKAVEDSIADHKALAEKSGVPNVDKTLAQADAKFAETQANKDFNSKFFGNQSVISGNVAHGVPEKIDVDTAIKTLENFDKPNKFGVSRLQMTSLGKDGAFKLKQVLYNAQKAGQTAMDSRALRNTILKLLGVGAGAVEGYHLFTKSPQE